MRSIKIRTLAALFCGISLLVTAPLQTLSETSDFASSAIANFTIFGTPQNIGAPVNTGANESGVALAPNGLSLYFSSNADGSLGSIDLWVSQRSTITAAWGTPQNLGILNSIENENLPALSADGKTMFFNSSGRADSLGATDIYMTTRPNPNDDFGWTAPVNLGPVINTADGEVGAGFFQDPTNGTEILYFTSNRPGGLGVEDIYQSRRNANGTFNTPTNVAELNSPALNRGLNIRRDGLEIFFSSDRDGGSGGRDIYVSTRPSLAAPWNQPVNLGSINSPGSDQSPFLSPDGSTLYFSSSRDGSPDIYTAQRVSVNRSQTADFDGDARSDISVFRPSDGTWHILQSSTNTYSVQRFGLNGDQIVPGDYDGDGRTDTAVFRPSDRNWYVRLSSDGTVAVTNWGLNTDRLVPADYDGDGRTDIAVYRDGVWYILQSSNGSVRYQFGVSTDIPIAAG